MYYDPMDKAAFMAKLKYYLDRPDEAKRIGLRGHAFSCRHHRTVNRADYLLNVALFHKENFVPAARHRRRRRLLVAPRAVATSGAAAAAPPAPRSPPAGVAAAVAPTEAAPEQAALWAHIAAHTRLEQLPTGPVASPSNRTAGGGRGTAKAGLLPPRGIRRAL